MRDALHLAQPAPMRQPHAARPLIALVFEGLSELPKQLPSTLSFDAIGSGIYDALRVQAEHYPARVEDDLLRRHAGDIAALAGTRPALIDYGAGDGRQARVLLHSLRDPLAYVPLDVEASQLRFARERMRTFRAHLPVFPLCQDLRDYVVLPLAAARASRKVGLLGALPFDSLRPLEAVAVLNSIRETLGPEGGLVVGVGLCQKPDTMRRAYEDAAGRAGSLSRNILERLNRELRATFDPPAFRHTTRWNETQQRVEVALVSCMAQVPRVAGIDVPLAADEEIVTLHSYKYTPEGFATLARIAGWGVRKSWTDAARMCCLYYLDGSAG